MKIGIIIIEYIKKYVMVYNGFVMYNSPSIQPMWVIDE
jgi:hypothetical protein